MKIKTEIYLFIFFIQRIVDNNIIFHYFLYIRFIHSMMSDINKQMVLSEV